MVTSLFPYGIHIELYESRIYYITFVLEYIRIHMNYMGSSLKILFSKVNSLIKGHVKFKVT